MEKSGQLKKNTAKDTSKKIPIGHTTKPLGKNYVLKILPDRVLA